MDEEKSSEDKKDLEIQRFKVLAIRLKKELDSYKNKKYDQVFINTLSVACQTKNVNEEYEVKNENLAKEFEKLKMENERLDGQVRRLHIQFGQVEENNELMRLKDLEIENYDKCINTLKDNLAQLELELITIKNSNDELTNKIQSKECSLKEITYERDKYLDQITTSSLINASYDEKITELTTRNNALIEENRYNLLEMERLKENHIYILTKLENSSKTKAMTLQKDLEESRKEHETYKTKVQNILSNDSSFDIKTVARHKPVITFDKSVQFTNDFKCFNKHTQTDVDEYQNLRVHFKTNIRNLDINLNAYFNQILNQEEAIFKRILKLSNVLINFSRSTTTRPSDLGFPKMTAICLKPNSPVNLNFTNNNYPNLHLDNNVDQVLYNRATKHISSPMTESIESERFLNYDRLNQFGPTIVAGVGKDSIVKRRGKNYTPAGTRDEKQPVSNELGNQKSGRKYGKRSSRNSNNAHSSILKDLLSPPYPNSAPARRQTLNPGSLTPEAFDFEDCFDVTSSSLTSKSTSTVTFRESEVRGDLESVNKRLDKSLQKIDHLSQLLAEQEWHSSRLMEQIELLKREIRRLDEQSSDNNTTNNNLRNSIEEENDGKIMDIMSNGLSANVFLTAEELLSDERRSSETEHFDQTMTLKLIDSLKTDNGIYLKNLFAKFLDWESDAKQRKALVPVITKLLDLSTKNASVLEKMTDDHLPFDPLINHLSLATNMVSSLASYVVPKFVAGNKK